MLWTDFYDGFWEWSDSTRRTRISSLEDMGSGEEVVEVIYEIQDPSFLVFRHNGNRKWFAVIMDIPRKNLKLPGEGEISVANLKCDPRLIGTFREEPGIFSGWHMNKAHWLTVALDGSVEAEKIKFLVDMSYELTKK